MTRTYVLVEVNHSKDIAELTDLVAGRVYTLDGVEDTAAIILDTKTAYWMAKAQTEKQ